MHCCPAIDVRASGNAVELRLETNDSAFVIVICSTSIGIRVYSDQNHEFQVTLINAALGAICGPHCQHTNVFSNVLRLETNTRQFKERIGEG